MGYIQLANTSENVVEFSGIKVPAKTSISVSRQVLDAKDLKGKQSPIILPLKDTEAEEKAKLEAEKESETPKNETEEPAKSRGRGRNKNN